MSEPKNLFSHYLELSKTELFPALLDKPAFNDLLYIGRQFPADISSFWGFECRLAETQKKVDLLFEIKKNSPAHIFLQNRVNSDKVELQQLSPVWKQLTDFAVNWQDSCHPFNHHIRNIWLEFDTATILGSDDRKKTLAYPSVFWGPEPHAEITDELLQHLIRVMNSLAQIDISSDRLQLIATSLPDNAQLFQFGVMSSRQVPIVRMCINHIAYDDIIPFLKRSNWKGNVDNFRTIIDCLKRLVTSVAIDLDVSANGIGEKIGLECYMDWGCEDASQWLPLLTFLSDRQLLKAEKMEGLLGFPRNRKLALSDQFNDDLTDTVYQIFYQNIHHIKLTYTDSELIEAKAYLGVYRPGLNKKIFGFKQTDGTSRLLDDQWIIA